LANASGAEYVTTSVGPPLGIGPSTYQETAFTMPVESTLILYTDGLIERRSEGIDIGMRRLADTAGPKAQDPLEGLISGLLTDLRHQDAADDIAVLALRRIDL
jgi:serine phosphatase RsbU (regulator of sigma subunit)